MSHDFSGAKNRPRCSLVRADYAPITTSVLCSQSVCLCRVGTNATHKKEIWAREYASQRVFYGGGKGILALFSALMASALTGKIIITVASDSALCPSQIQCSLDALWNKERGVDFEGSAHDFKERIQFNKILIKKGKFKNNVLQFNIFPSSLEPFYMYLCGWHARNCYANVNAELGKLTFEVEKVDQICILLLLLVRMAEMMMMLMRMIMMMKF